MHYMLENHQKRIEKSNFFTVIPFSIRFNESISAIKTPLPFQNSFGDFLTHHRL